MATNTAPPAASGEKADGKPSTRPNPVALEAAVTVTGARPSSEGTRDLFTEETRTILVFVDGAVIQLAAGVAVGQLLFLTNQRTKEEVVCQILQKRVFRPTVCYVEVQFTEEKPNFWGVPFGKEQPGRVEFKIAEQVEAQETIKEAPEAAVAPKSEQEIEELKRQVESLRQQLQKLEKRKAQGPVAPELAPVNDPVPLPQPAPEDAGTVAEASELGRGGEALLMPEAAPEGKKTPRWAVPMALPGREKTAEEVAAGRDASEELLPEPELDFSHVPSAVHAEENDPRSIYKPKGIPPHRMRQIALGVALACIAGFAAYAKVWTTFPVLKNAAAGALQQVKNAGSNHSDAKANAPVPVGDGATKGISTGTVATSKGEAANVIQPAQRAGSAVPNGREAAATETRDSGTHAADHDDANTSANAPAENRQGSRATKKGLNARERTRSANRDSVIASEPAEKSSEPLAPDGPVIGPKLVHAAAPVYPPDAMWNYITGDVKAELVVGPDGKVGEVRVISGPKALRDAAVEALRRYEYAPATQGGRPLAAKTTATVKFWFNP